MKTEKNIELKIAKKEYEIRKLQIELEYYEEKRKRKLKYDLKYHDK